MKAGTRAGGAAAEADGFIAARQRRERLLAGTIGAFLLIWLCGLPGLGSLRAQKDSSYRLLWSQPFDNEGWRMRDGNGDALFLECRRPGMFSLSRLNPATGERLWQSRLDVPLDNGELTEEDGCVLPALSDGGLLKLDLATGETRWRFSARPEDYDGQPPAAECPAARYFCRNGALLYGVDADGALCWSSYVEEMQAAHMELMPLAYAGASALAIPKYNEPILMGAYGRPLSLPAQFSQYASSRGGAAGISLGGSSTQLQVLATPGRSSVLYACNGSLVLDKGETPLTIPGPQSSNAPMNLMSESCCCDAAGGFVLHDNTDLAAYDANGAALWQCSFPRGFVQSCSGSGQLCHALVMEADNPTRSLAHVAGLSAPFETYLAGKPGQIGRQFFGETNRLTLTAVQDGRKTSGLDLDITRVDADAQLVSSGEYVVIRTATQLLGYRLVSAP